MKELLEQRIREVYPKGTIRFEGVEQGYGTDVREDREEFYFPITIYCFKVTTEKEDIQLNAEVYSFSNPNHLFVDFMEWVDGWERVESRTYDKLLKQWVQTIVA